MTTHDPARLDAVRRVLGRTLGTVPGEPRGTAHARAILDALAAHGSTDDTARLRALVADVVTAAFHARQQPEWMTDDLWARLVAEVPKPDTWTRAPAADADDGHALF